MRVVQHKYNCQRLLKEGYRYRLELWWDGFMYGGSISYRTVSSQQEAISLITMHQLHVERIDARDLVRATLWLRAPDSKIGSLQSYEIIEWLPDND